MYIYRDNINKTNNPIHKKVKYIILLCCLTMQLMGQVVGLTMLQNKEYFKMHFRSVQGFIVVDVMYGAIFPMRFIFDTGAQNTVMFDRRLAELLPIKYDKEVTLLGADLKTEVKAMIARNMIFQIGKSPLFTKDVIVLKEDHVKLRESLGEDIHGIMGADFTRGMIVQIDYCKNEITLFSSNKINPKRYNNFTKTEAVFEQGKIFLSTGIISERKDTVNLKLLLDTGAGISAMFHKNSSEKIKLPTQYINGHLGRGLGGEITGIIGKVDEFTLGQFSFYNLISYYQNIDSIHSENQIVAKRNGLLGNVVLNNFTLLIDYVKEEIYLKPNKQYKKEIRYDRSGILLIAQGEKLDKILIHDIIPGSPAEKAGLQKGDQIIAVKKFSLRHLTIGYLSKNFSDKLGKPITVKVKRDGKKITCNMVLADLL